MYLTLIVLLASLAKKSIMFFCNTFTALSEKLVMTFKYETEVVYVQHVSWLLSLTKALTSCSLSVFFWSFSGV